MMGAIGLRLVVSCLQLKPYVSYRVREVRNEAFTPQDLFHAVYTDKVIRDYKEGKLQEDGSPLEASEEEQLEAEEARNRALRTGSDYL